MKNGEKTMYLWAEIHEIDNFSREIIIFTHFIVRNETGLSLCVIKPKDSENVIKLIIQAQM